MLRVVCGVLAELDRYVVGDREPLSVSARGLGACDALQSLRVAVPATSRSRNELHLKPDRVPSDKLLRLLFALEHLPTTVDKLLLRGRGLRAGRACDFTGAS